MANKLTEGRWTWPDHLDALSLRLAKGSLGRNYRLLVMMPPRHGKSETISHWFPVWFLDRFPDRRAILASYEAGFAAEWGRKVRNTIEEHREELQVRLSRDSTAADSWKTTEGGGMVTAGVGGPITGRGADLLMVDDPVKNAEEANSQTYREKVWQWWQSTAYTRLEPGGMAVVLMTRWHEDDLIGRLLADAENGGEQWDVLCLPAIAEENDQLGRAPGTPLWPQRYDLPALTTIQRSVGSYVWNALYQQRPKAPEGGYFKRAWFAGNIVERERVPELVSTVRYWDLAATALGENGNADPDYVAGCLMGVSAHGTFYIMDVTRLRASAAEVDRTVEANTKADGRSTRVRIEQEPGSAGKLLINHYARMLPGYDVRGVSSTGSKAVRSQAFNAACERGDVKLVAGKWNREFIEELASFRPDGDGHDDQVDASSGAFNDLTQSDRSWDSSDFARLMKPAAVAGSKSPGQLLMERLRGRGR